MTSPAAAAADAIDVAVPAYDEDPEEDFRGPGIAEFFNEDDEPFYEGLVDPLEVSAPQSGGPQEAPHVDVVSDHTQLQQAVVRINKDFDVRGLCMEFPDRLHDLANKTYGDRLPK